MSNTCLPYKVVDGKRVPVLPKAGGPIKPVGGPITAKDVKVPTASFRARRKEDER